METLTTGETWAHAAELRAVLRTFEPAAAVTEERQLFGLWRQFTVRAIPSTMARVRAALTEWREELDAREAW